MERTYVDITGDYYDNLDKIIDWGEDMNQNYRESLELLDPRICWISDYRLSERWKLVYGAGIGMSYLTRSNVYLITRYESPEGVLQSTKNGLAERYRFQPNLNLVLGMDYNLKFGKVGICLNGQYFIRPTVDPGERYSDDAFIFQNQYLNDEVSLRSLGIVMRYSIPLVYQVKAPEIN